MVDNLRDQDRKVLELVVQVIEDRDEFVSAREIQRSLGLYSLANVESSLRKLERDGYIRRTGPDSPPGFEVLRHPDSSEVQEQPHSDGSARGSESLPYRRAESNRVPNLSKLSVRQLQVYEFISTQMLTTGNPPSIEEIMQEFSLSKTRVYQLLEELEQKGFIRLPREPGESGELRRRKARRIELIGWEPPQLTTTSAVQVPVLTKIAAGWPSSAEQGLDDWLEVPKQLIGQNEPELVFALIVDGDSMKDDGVLEGDYVVVRRQSEALDGDMVVAKLLEEGSEAQATIKRLRHKGGRVQLEPANTAYQPVDGDQANIVGKVIGLLRFKM